MDEAAMIGITVSRQTGKDENKAGLLVLPKIMFLTATGKSNAFSPQRIIRVVRMLAFAQQIRVADNGCRRRGHPERQANHHQ